MPDVTIYDMAELANVSISTASTLYRKPKQQRGRARERGESESERR